MTDYDAAAIEAAAKQKLEDLNKDQEPKEGEQPPIKITRAEFDAWGPVKRMAMMKEASVGKVQLVNKTTPQTRKPKMKKPNSPNCRRQQIGGSSAPSYFQTPKRKFRARHRGVPPRYSGRLSLRRV